MIERFKALLAVQLIENYLIVVRSVFIRQSEELISICFCAPGRPYGAHLFSVSDAIAKHFARRGTCKQSVSAQRDPHEIQILTFCLGHNGSGLRIELHDPVA